jgi:Uma2 family endonuclease
MRTSVVRAGELVPTADQRLVMNSISWDRFEALLRTRGDQPVPRVAYLDGAVELMSPSKGHERIKSLIGCLVEAYAIDCGLEIMPYGSWTLKRRQRQAGAEPDECYIVGDDQDKTSPDLAIEVVWTSGGLDKLEIYRRLQVGEVWVWIDGKIQVHLLRRGRYHRALRSALFPHLDLRLLGSYLDQPTMTRAVSAFRKALERSRRRPLRRPLRRRR